MKKAVVSALVIGALAWSAKQFFFEQAESSAKVTEEVEVQPVAQAEPEVAETAPVTKPVVKAPETLEQPREEFKEVMAATLSGDRRQQQEQALEKVKELFPQLKEEIESYQFETDRQHEKLAQYKQLTAKRNTLVKEGHVPEDLILQLKEEREALLAAAKTLGERGMKINAAIREAAIEYEQNL
ncbi:hypothetical protein SG34_000170 [Thalassomonas viridans]|uniref:Uncharacterized protein n=1 Tax=Thalassomonas viridans TaxID=137584 RepID=A0AAE9Z2K2_9GAMM|nr:hypothetical protein [Thalassomonas viridans]WDE05403.1 hypothetical protein SG34_000170 [Thalassomonas viridans]